MKYIKRCAAKYLNKQNKLRSNVCWYGKIQPFNNDNKWGKKIAELDFLINVDPEKYLEIKNVLFVSVLTKYTLHISYYFK